MGVTLSLVILGLYFFLKSLEKADCGIPDVVPVAEKLLEAALSNTTNSILDLDDQDRGFVNATGNSTNPCPEPYTGGLGWLPVFLLMKYIFFFNLGYGSMIWITGRIKLS